MSIEHEGAFSMAAEKEAKSEIHVEVIAPDGLGYGDPEGISVQRQLENGELHQDSLTAAIEIVRTDNEVFVEVDHEANDDGCGDGRPVKRIFRVIDSLTGKVKEYSKSLRRAKLFGGGLIASSSMWRAVEGEPVREQTVMGDRAFLSQQLRDRQVSYGAHTDNHAHGEKCGCGAIDRYDEITRNAVRFREQITGTLRVLYGAEFSDNQSSVDDVFSVYATLNDAYFDGATGRKTMDFIEQDGVIVKELADGHLEDMVVLNDIEGTTLDQEKLREKLSEKDLSPNIQAFVVDVWRGRMYAELVAAIAAERGIDRELAYKRAFADFLIRTCAVSATLTAGDQPVIYRSSVSVATTA